MKRNLRVAAAIGAALFTSALALAENKPAAAPAAPAANQPAQPKLKPVLLGRLEGAEKVEQFQNNVRVLQQQYAAAVELNAALEKEKDPEKKKKLKADFDNLSKLVNENNAAMFKAYGFTVTRNYNMVIQSADIYMLVTEEEAVNLEKQQKEAAQKAPAKAAEKAPAKASDGKKK